MLGESWEASEQVRGSRAGKGLNLSLAVEGEGAEPQGHLEQSVEWPPLHTGSDSLSKPWDAPDYRGSSAVRRLPRSHPPLPSESSG